MLRGVLRTARYARSWSRGADVVSHEIEIVRSGEKVPATLVLPRKHKGDLPGWIALGGISRMGRFHPQLMRFGQALASSGAAVLLPEVPEWRRLTVPPRVTAPTVRGCIEALRARPEVSTAKLGLIGFSFGAPQAAIAAAQADLADELAGVVLFGGYCCLERTLICQLTGDHEWDGVDYSLSPDPYGGWVVGSNYLPLVPGYEDAVDVQSALHRLAVAASDLRISAWQPHHDAMITELRAGIAPERRGLFDLFATPSTATRPAAAERREIAKRLAETCRRIEPLLEPAEALTRVAVPTRLIHGRGDRLIPFTESLRFSEALPTAARAGLTVTGLFNHSADSPATSLADRVREGTIMLSAIRGLINTT
jgi:pimeloyl-ACP methyl ester carboxylesterase